MRRDKNGPHRFLEDSRKIRKITGHSGPCVADNCFEPSGENSLLCEKHKDIGGWYFHTQIANDPKPHLQNDIQMAYDWAWVYFLGNRDMGFVKIGTTTRLKSRMSSLRNSSPVPIKLMALVCSDPALEYHFHQQFQGDRLHGEWFRLTDRIADTIESIKKQQFGDVIPDGYLFTTEEKIRRIALMMTLNSDDIRREEEDERTVDLMRNIGQC